jgi:2',5'-phosphodiesterase
MRLQSILKFVNTRVTVSSVRIREACQKMHNAYIRCHDGAGDFQFSFQLRNELLGVDRQFNFSRQLSEKVSDFLARISTSVERSVNKKKKKRKGISTEEKQENANKIEVSLLRDGEQVPGDQLCKDILFDSGLCLLLLDAEYSVILNAPWVTLITLPSSIMAGFPVYPLKLEVLFADKSDCTFCWYKNIHTSTDKRLPTNWVEVGSGFYYTPSTCDIGCHLKVVCAPQNGSACGPTSEIVSKNPVEAGPGVCPFELRHAFTKERLNGKT